MIIICHKNFRKTNSPHKKSYPQNALFVIFAMLTSLPISFEHVQMFLSILQNYGFFCIEDNLNKTPLTLPVLPQQN